MVFPYVHLILVVSQEEEEGKNWITSMKGLRDSRLNVLALSLTSAYNRSLAFQS